MTDSARAFLRGQLSYMSLEAGYDVHVVASPGEGLDDLARAECVVTHPLRMSRNISPGADLASLVAWLRLLRRVRPAVVNVGTPKAGLIGSVSAWLLGVPTRVYVVRGLRLESETGRLRRLLIAMEWITIRCATDVVAVSPSIRDALVEMRLVNGRRMHVIGLGSSNGVDCTGISARVAKVDRSAARQGLGLSPDEFVVLYLGRLNRDKGMADLATAMTTPGLADARLVTVGTADDVSSVDQLSVLGPRWIRRDWATDVTEFLAIADVFCLPTHREGFPNVVLEASSAGLPVVTTTATGARDSVQHGVTGLTVPPHDPTALSDALVQLKGAPATRQAMGRAGFTWVEANFRPELIWQGLSAVYGRENDTA